MRTITQELHVTVYGLKSRSRSEIDMLFIMTETNSGVTFLSRVKASWNFDHETCLKFNSKKAQIKESICLFKASLK